ncbi:MAG: CCA tRNA nucleotidyltransferase [Phycisphaerales bacterium]|nr:CCA tRNA nucleotidyltransferase [Phycisphaerales bacterium]
MPNHCTIHFMSNDGTAKHVATEIVRQLQQAGYVAYFAGGCVRDQIMHLEPKDFDVATSARPAQILQLFPHGQKVGAAFGVILVRKRGWPIEVATFRSDGRYEDGRHPVDISFADAQGDAHRRDFTCNGLFWDPIADVLHDYVGGQADIQNNILRAIGDAAARFAEDHLRVLRAVRFAARLEFTIEPTTWHAMQRAAVDISGVSRERIGEELRHIMRHPTRGRAGQLLFESGLLSHILPIATANDGGRHQRYLGGLPAHISFGAGLAALVLEFCPAAPAARQTADALRTALTLSGHETADVGWLLENLAVLENWRDLSLAQFKRLLAHRLSDDLLALYFTRAPEQADILRHRIAELRSDGVAPEPFVTGEDLIQLGATPGPQFKQWLYALYDMQLENRLPDRTAALMAARKMLGGEAAGG